MNTRIKIVKRNRNAEDANKSEVEPAVDSTNAPPAKNKTRAMVNTVKSWIAELNERKRLQAHSFSPLTATSPVHVATFRNR